METVHDDSGRTMRIQMLGGFELSCAGRALNESSNRSYQLWNLLEYLIAYRHSDISQSQIIETLWPDDRSNNPANALKNLIYRIRTAIASAGFPLEKDVIKYSGGKYFFNNELSCVVDAEAFEALCKRAFSHDVGAAEQQELLTRALALYKGDFLPRSKYEPWVVPLATYYRGLYMRCVVQVVALYKQQDRHEDIIAVCERALLVDQFEEILHEEIIRALIAQNKHRQAMEHYQRATDLFYRGMGVKLSESLRGLYQDIIKTINTEELDLVGIQEDLREESRESGAFLCDYEIFRNMYRLEARSASRSGQAIFLGLLTIVPDDDVSLDQKLLNNAMNKLLAALRVSLRLGDVISRFSATQYVVMLPTLTFENGQMVLGRISKRFSSLCRNPSLKLHISLRPMEPLV